MPTNKARKTCYKCGSKRIIDYMTSYSTRFNKRGTWYCLIGTIDKPTCNGKKLPLQTKLDLKF